MIETTRTFRDLTPRQREIVQARCFSDGSIEEVARALGITASTVKNHSTEIMDRLGIGSFQRVCTLAGIEFGRANMVVAQRPEMV